MTTYLLWEEYRRKIPNDYGLTQFRYHLKQKTVTVKPSIVFKAFYQPAGKMYIDFVDDKLDYVDMETDEIVYVEMFAAVLPCSGYTVMYPLAKHQTRPLHRGCNHTVLRNRAMSPCTRHSSFTVKVLDKWSPTLTDGFNNQTPTYTRSNKADIHG